MNVLIASDSFKGSLTSMQVAGYIREGILRVYPEAEVEAVSIADGGEGTVEAVVSAVNGTYREVNVHGPLGALVRARYGLIDSNTAVIEMAESSGLSLVSGAERNPMKASSYGFGEQIRDALELGCKRIILGIGGSATNDGGAGMAAALGARFLDEGGAAIEVNGGSLDRVKDIDVSGIIERLNGVEIITASDVTNPLCGEKGASRIYGPQKGATPEMVDKLDSNLAHFAEIIKEQMGKDIAEIPGAGAAGGVGAGLMAFCNARIEKGIEFILDVIEIDSRIRKADIVITGEGRIDGQSIYGKVPVGIAGRAKKHGKPVYAICGCIGKDAGLVYNCGIDGVLSAVAAPVTLEEAIKDSPGRLRDTAENLFRIIRSTSAIDRVKIMG